MICLQVHNEYLIPGGETNSVKLIANTLEENNIKVVRYYKDNKDIENATKIQKLIMGVSSIYNFTTVKEINKILKDNKIDFALVHNASPLISNSIYSILLKKKVPVYKYLQNYNLICLNGGMGLDDKCEECQKNSFIGVKYRCYKNNIIYTLQKYVSSFILKYRYIKKISGFIAISNFVAEKHINSGIPKGKVHTLYHFCENKSVYKEVDKTKDDYIFYFGRLEKNKGILTLIAIMEDLPNYKLKIAGSGALEDSIETYISEKNLSNIDFVGYKTGKELDELISIAKVCIIPSEWEEPFGRTVIESYQQGTPVIVSNIGGLKELVADGLTGFKFESKNKEDLINQIKKIYELNREEYLKLRFNSCEAINTKFYKKNYIDSFKKIINI